MYITGRITKALPKLSGTSQRTGNTWESQEFVIEYFENPSDRFPDRLVFRVMGAERLKDWNIQEGEENVTVGIGHKTNEYQGRYYNEISAFSFSRNGMQRPATDTNQPTDVANQPAGGAQTSAAVSNPTPQAQAPQNVQISPAPQQAQQSAANDDLPF